MALLVSVLACLVLGRITYRTDWGMDADEAVHAVEALRLYDRLADGEIGGFLHDTWFPERWQPPVNPHVRWYPFVHAWATVPSFVFFGPSDFTARLPSIFFLLGSCLLFFELGRRLAPRTGAASGLLATLLLLASPNVLTFSAQSLTEPASLFFSFLAVLAYVWSLEKEHPWGRAIAAGFALGIAMLTKYDHGGLLALCLGIAELIRQRFRVERMLQTGAGVLFLLPLFMIVAWFAHPDKLDALKDSVSHPFAGSGRLVALDFFLTWVTEYGSSLAMGAIAIFALATGWRRSEPAVRAVWLWAVITAVFLGIRSRFHFRYNFVEAPIFLLLAAIVLPDALDRLAQRMSRGGTTLGRVFTLVAGVLLTTAGVAAALSPDGFFDVWRAPFTHLYELREDHWGLSLAPDAYIDHFATEYRALAVYFGSSTAALGIALLVLGVGGLFVRMQPGEAVFAPGLAWTALAVALVPGAMRLYANLEEMVEWELECHPELGDLHAFVNERCPSPGSVLLGGGWDQLTNNGIRWYRVTCSDGPRPDYDEVPVLGDMIGSLVFPPEPRIRHWARVLAEAPADELPDRIVLVDYHDEGFRYRTRMGPEVDIYRDVLAERGGYRSLESRTFEELGCDAEILVRRAQTPGPMDGVEAILARHGVGEETEGNASRVIVGEGGWSMRDESLRHFVDR
ncbi:MAG: glycosyltransferase family 39 protein [Planctomycetota bacterium]